MKLFPECERRDPRPALHEEGSYAFLNRVRSPYWSKVRDVLESWFNEYPAEAKADLLGRFSDRDATQHFPAWWELYLFVLFSRMGFDVRVHPDTGARSTSPDLHCVRGDTAFYVEAAAVFSGIVDPGRNAAREGWILDLINDGHSPNFFVWVGFEAVGSERPRRTEVVPPIEEWLATLDPDSVSRDLGAGGDAPAMQLDFRDWSMTLRAIPVREERRGAPGKRLLGAGPMSAGFVNDIEMLRRTLSRKFKHYGELDAPLLVAVLAMSSSVDRDDVEQVLFGTEAVQFSRESPEDARLVRRPDGVWFNGAGPAGTAVSGVMVSSHLRPWTCAEVLPELWLHPWAQVSLEGVLPLSTAHVAADGGMVYVEATTMAWQLMGLSAGWPGPEAPFE